MSLLRDLLVILLKEFRQLASLYAPLRPCLAIGVNEATIKFLVRHCFVEWYGGLLLKCGELFVLLFSTFVKHKNTRFFVVVVDDCHVERLRIIKGCRIVLLHRLLLQALSIHFV